MLTSVHRWHHCSDWCEPVGESHLHSDGHRENHRDHRDRAGQDDRRAPHRPDPYKPEYQQERAEPGRESEVLPAVPCAYGD